VWYVPISNATSPTQLTNYPIEDATNLKYSSNGQFLAFSAMVYVDCASDFKCTADRDKSQAALGPNTGFVHTSLYVRHWASWEVPNKHSHIFVQRIAQTGASLSLHGDPIDMMKGMQAESPVPPFGGAEQFDISPDSTEISFTAEIIRHDTAWTTDWKTFVRKIDGSEATDITSQIKARTSNPSYQPTGSYLAYLAMDRPGLESDRFHINLYDRKSGSTKCLTCKWDVSVNTMTWTIDGKYLLVSATNIGNEKLFLIDVENGNVKTLIEQATNSGVSPIPGTSQYLLTRHSMSTSQNLWKFDLNGEMAHNLKQITFVNVEKLKQMAIAVPKKIFFTGADDQKVQAWIMHPINFDETKKYPLAVLIHGGPEQAFENRWMSGWNAQLWSSRGYGVLQINFHGSPGFGQNFTDSIRNNWGGSPFIDIMKGTDYVIETEKWVDANRMAACGASYGGYMINWIAGNTNRFKCLVNHDGVFDTMAMYYGTEELWFPEAEYCAIQDIGCVPWDKPSGYEKWNPRNYVKVSMIACFIYL
jgi:dipeptidyl aminopeptidase/acylaminoacyl peptidase